MQSTSWEMLGWKKHKLESRLPGEISITSDMQMIPKWRGTKKPLDEIEREEWKSWLKAQHSPSQASATNFQMFKLVLEKAEEPEIRLPTSAGSWEKQESSRKTSISALVTMLKPLAVWITINCGKFWKGWEYQTTWLASWETYMQVRKHELELDMEQQTGSK